MKAKTLAACAAAAATLALAACDSPEQNAREAAARQSDQIVAAQTGQEYDGPGPREQAADRLEESYVPTVEAVATSRNTPVETTGPNEIPPPPDDRDPATVFNAAQDNVK